MCELVCIARITGMIIIENVPKFMSYMEQWAMPISKLGYSIRTMTMESGDWIDWPRTRLRCCCPWQSHLSVGSHCVLHSGQHIPSPPDLRASEDVSVPYVGRVFVVWDIRNPDAEKQVRQQ